MAAGLQQLSGSAVVRSLRRFTDAYFPARVRADDRSAAPESAEEGDEELRFLDSLPVDLQFLIMTLLSPVDICRLGATSRYWRAVVRDPLLWRFLLLRDMPRWPSIDHVTMPRLEPAGAPPSAADDADDAEEAGGAEEMGRKPDYMAEYLKGCPSCRQKWLPSRPTYQILSSLIQTLVPSAEPRYAMFGPGMEQLDVSLVTRLMHAPELLPVAGTPYRQINGVGSGISYLYNQRHKFNILTLYSANRAERERARVQNQNWSNKLFNYEGGDESGRPIYSPAAHVQQVCQAVDGFIYVANAEPGRGQITDEGEAGAAQIRAVLGAVSGSASRPLLVLSCVSREEEEEEEEKAGRRRRTPCVDMAKRLDLPKLAAPWMVQDTVAESLRGLLDGISWLLRRSGVKVHAS